MPERLTWTPSAWEDYQYWQTQDKKTLKRINLLIQDAMRSPFEGIGKPEPLERIFPVSGLAALMRLTAWYTLLMVLIWL